MGRENHFLAFYLVMLSKVKVVGQTVQTGELRQTDTQTDGCHQMLNLPALWPMNIWKLEGGFTQ